jgi:hypothetical protein
MTHIKFKPRGYLGKVGVVEPDFGVPAKVSGLRQNFHFDVYSGPQISDQAIS